MTCQLYRHYDKENRLLYVGISLSALARFQSHKSLRKPWISDISRVDVEQFPFRWMAEEAEKTAIMTERPIFNIAGNELAKLERSSAVERDAVNVPVGGSIPPAPAKGRPRKPVKVNGTSAGEPWKALGISERTWWRRKAEARGK